MTGESPPKVAEKRTNWSHDPRMKEAVHEQDTDHPVNPKTKKTISIPSPKIYQMPHLQTMLELIRARERR